MQKKYKLLLLGLLFDAIGMASIVFPIMDVVWAPLSAFLIYKMYKGTEGKIGGLVTFVEEAIPGLDIIPTFTLTWIYKYLLKRNN